MNHALVELLLYLIVVSCVLIAAVEIPAWKIFDQDIYFRIVDPTEVAFLYRASPAKNFGRGFTKYYEHSLLIVADPISGCVDFKNPEKIVGHFVLVERGECSFVEKVHRSERAGAVGVIVYDNNPDNRSNLVAMVDDDSGKNVNIPSLFIVGSDGFHIRRALSRHNLESAIINVPINITFTPEYQLNKPPWNKII